jgi:DNA repair exonuclease SbcCD ATPase subunit
MAEAMAVKQDIKTTPIKYKKDRSNEEAELQQLEEERRSLLQEQKAEEEDKVETESLAPEEKTFKKRYGDLRRHSQQKEEQLKEQIRALETQLSTATKEAIQLPKSDEEISEWSEKYPDVAKIVESIATKKAQELDSTIEKRLELIAEREADANRKRAEAELLQLHPDFDDIRNDEEFHGWVQEQPTWVQQALYENENDARSAARAIDLYKVDRDIADKKESVQKADKAAAQAVSSRGQSTVADTKEAQSNQWRESDVAKMRPQEFAKNEEAIMQAIQSGNFIYDVSRGGQ